MPQEQKTTGTGRHASSRSKSTPPKRSASQARQGGMFGGSSGKQRRRLSTFSTITLMPRTSMPPFNMVRVIIYLAVLVFTVICLGIAAHFMSVLTTTDDLTRFVPFALFVASASIFFISMLLILSLMRKNNPISTRLEMACLGLVGFFWLALGIFTATSEAQDAEVECFVDDNTSEPIDLPGFTTETFQAQYRVLEAFSLLNASLLLGFLLLLLVLAMRQHRMGYKQVWAASVTDYPWLGGKKPHPLPKRQRLPSPVTAAAAMKEKPATRSASRPAAPPPTRPIAATPIAAAHSRPQPQPLPTSRTLAMASAGMRKDTGGAQRPPPPRQKTTAAPLVWVPPPDKARTKDDRMRPSMPRQTPKR